MGAPHMRATSIRQVLIASLTIFVLTTPRLGYSQAWVPAQGRGNVSLSYVYFVSGDHLYSEDLGDVSTRGYPADGKRWYLGDTEAHTLVATLNYGLPKRLAVSASVAYVTSRYQGNAPANLEIDDGEYHGTFQDAGFELRWMALTRPLVVTPFIGYGFPTTNYATSGHTAVGRNLQEARVGLMVARLLYPWISSVYVHGRYTYAAAEQVLDLNLRRSALDLEVGYLAAQWLVMSASASFQNTHGGLEWASDDPDHCAHCPGTEGRVNQVSAARFVNIAFSAAVGLPYNLNIYAAVSSTVWGENIEDGEQFTAGTSWMFSTPWAD